MYAAKEIPTRRAGGLIGNIRAEVVIGTLELFDWGNLEAGKKMINLLNEIQLRSRKQG